MNTIACPSCKEFFESDAKPSDWVVCPFCHAGFHLSVSKFAITEALPLNNDTLSSNDTQTGSQGVTPPPSTVVQAHSLLWLEITLYAFVLFGEAASRGNAVAGLFAAGVAIAIWGCITRSLLKGSSGRLIVSVLAPFVLLFSFGYGLLELVPDTPIRFHGSDSGSILRVLGALNILRGFLFVRILSLLWNPESSAWYRINKIASINRKTKATTLERLFLPVNRSYVAVIAGYFGLISITLWPAPVSLIVGLLALRHIKKHPEKIGKGRAWFAVSMGALFTIVLLIVSGRILKERAQSQLPEIWNESNGVYICFADSFFPPDVFDEIVGARPLALCSTIVDSLMKSTWKTHAAPNPSKARGLSLRVSCPSSFECRDGSKPITPFYCSPTRSYPAKTIPEIRIRPSFTIDIGTTEDLPEELLSILRDVEVGEISRDDFNAFRTSFLESSRFGTSGAGQCVDVGFAKTKFGVSMYVTKVDAADDFTMIGTQFFIPVYNRIIIPQIAVAAFSTKGVRTDPPWEDFRAFFPVGLKFISGVTLLSRSATDMFSVDERPSQNVGGIHSKGQSSIDKPNFNETVLSLVTNPEMPKPWTGETGGMSWDWGDYYLVFETHPKSVVESDELLLDKTTKSQLLESARKTKYHFALFVYYKPGKNPSGEDSVRPCRVYTVESTKMGENWLSPFLCAFLPTARQSAEHLNYGYCPEENARARLLSQAVKDLNLEGVATDLGDPKEVHRLLKDVFETQSNQSNNVDYYGIAQKLEHDALSGLFREGEESDMITIPLKSGRMVTINLKKLKEAESYYKKALQNGPRDTAIASSIFIDALFCEKGIRVVESVAKKRPMEQLAGENIPGYSFSEAKLILNSERTISLTDVLGMLVSDDLTDKLLALQQDK